MDKRALQGHLTNARSELLDSIKDLSEAELIDLPVAGAWTIKDISAHIGGWAAWDLSSIEALQAGKHPDLSVIRDVDEFNRRLVASRKAWSMEDILDEMTTTQSALHAILADMPEADVFRGSSFRGPYWSNLAEWLQIACEHEEEHAAQIRAWRLSRQEPGAGPEAG
jgi:uncharacterized damage-inducible protein DinB